MAATSKASAATRKLSRYRAKRDFTRTAEPSGREPRAKAKGLSFVIQAHAARRMHHDFRLELGGVLLSWSVPKGPSLDPGERRLAVRTEDHPLAYATFEGIIPKGEYGGGTVVVWDRGTWEPEGDADEGVKKGRLTFTLHGDKLRGRWHLVRTRGRDEAHENWLLFKGKDEHASEERDIVAERPESVVTGRTLDEVAAAADKVWRSNRSSTATPADEPATASKTTKTARASKTTKARKIVTASKTTRATRPAAAADPPLAGADLVTLVRALPVGFELTNLDKVLWREEGVTKAQLLAYLAVTAERILPHVGGRPLTLVRCPDGAAKHCFFQKHLKPGTPPAIRPVPIADDEGTVEQYLRIDDLPGLVACAQLGTLELHTWGCHADKLERPDLLVFDLDPDPQLSWDRVVEGAITTRDALTALGLGAFVKTTGGKGLHVVSAVTRRLAWDEHTAFSRALVERIAAAAPTGYTTNPLKARRKGKIFLDYLRNGRGATFVAPYSPRARPGATVATPVTWAELEAGLDPLAFTIATVPPRLAGQREDPWETMEPRPITAAARKAVGA